MGFKTFSNIGLLFFTFTLNTFSQNLLLNGDFENNTSVGCDYNNSILEFNSLITDINAYANGTGGLDLMKGNTCFGVAAQSGNTKLGILKAEALSFSLSTPIVSGKSYNLSFYVANPTCCTAIQIVEVGMSQVNNMFGTSIIIANSENTDWQLVTTSFMAPSNANYLTLRGPTASGWMHVDNFILEEAMAPIPTISQWGIISLSLTLLILGIVTLKGHFLVHSDI